MKTLTHHTLLTGHIRESPIDEVDPDILEALMPLMDEAAQSGLPCYVGAEWWIRVWPRVETKDTFVGLFYQTADGTPEIMLLVTVEDPSCIVSLAGDVTLDREDLMRAADLERCLAWAWIGHAGDNPTE